MKEEQEKLLIRFALRYLMANISIDEPISEFMESTLEIPRYDDQFNALTNLHISMI